MRLRIAARIGRVRLWVGHAVDVWRSAFDGRILTAIPESLKMRSLMRHVSRVWSARKTEVRHPSLLGSEVTNLASAPDDQDLPSVALQQFVILAGSKLDVKEC
jgi:hypothetical protein